jgi:anaerobic dimethyl sulfoxide reductase subunit C (anchor subunit)
MILTAVFSFIQWRKVGNSNTLMIVGWITAFVGVVLIYCMGMTYMLPAQPAWHTLATPVNFYLTALLLGVMGTAVMLMTTYAKIQMKNADLDGFVKSTLQYIAISGIVLLGLQFLVLPLYMAFLSTQGGAAIRTLNIIFNDYGVLLALRLLLVFAGAGVLAVYLFGKAAVSGGEVALANITYSAFALVLLGEILARFLFYATQYRIGV